MSQLFTAGGQSTGASVSASVLPMNIQGWFPLELTGLISIQSQQFKTINSSALGLLYGPTLTSIDEYWKHQSFDYMDLCRQSDVSAFCLPRQMSFNFMAAVTICSDFEGPPKNVTASTFYPSICHEVTGVNARILSLFNDCNIVCHKNFITILSSGYCEAILSIILHQAIILLLLH